MTTSIRFQRAFSMIELLTTVSIVAILASVAVPSFDSVIKNSRRRQAMDSFWHAVFLARSEAIKRNGVVALCKSRDGALCDNGPGSWSDGWMVFENLDRDEPAQVDNGESVLRIYNATEQISVVSNRRTFTFRPSTQGSVNGTIVFCDARGSNEARAIIISHTGRPRQSTRDASNRPLSCPNT